MDIKNYTKSGPERIEAMKSALRHIDLNNVTGDIVECGVWRGGNIMLARKMCPKRVCWLYDTFEGMTEPGPFDLKRSGNKPPPNKAISKNWTKASLEEVKSNFIEFNLYDITKMRFVIGDVCLTLLLEKNLPENIALLRLDTDWYQSTAVELRQLYPRLVSGGIMIVDDYGHWLGARKAVDDYLSAKEIALLQKIDYTAVMMVKP